MKATQNPYKHWVFSSFHREMILRFFSQCRWPDSNRHGFPLDFESSASANSATAANIKFEVLHEPLLIIAYFLRQRKLFLHNVEIVKIEIYVTAHNCEK